MHENSLTAYREGCKTTLKKRKQLIFEAFWFGSKEMTDRECLRMLRPNSDNMNYCQPRISDLHEEGIFEECGTRYENGRPVRVSRVKQPATTPEKQVGMF